MATARHKACISVYLLLYRDNEILLGLRQNTGYQDGFYCLVAGHLEDGETAVQAMIREAKEEIGIDILPDGLQVVYMMHRRSDRDNIDIFLTCKQWTGELRNNEPDKCREIRFFPAKHIPANTCDFIVHALNDIQRGSIYNELGY